MPKDFYKQLPPWAKGVTGVIIVGGIAFVGYSIYQADKKAKELAKANAAANAALGDLAALAKKGIYPTLSDTEFEGLSQILVEAMNGCGTDEQSIYGVFSVLTNDADILKLIQVFGVRFYQPCAASQPLSYARWLWDDQAFGGGLPTWLGYDLTAGEIAHINKILADSGINYNF